MPATYIDNALIVRPGIGTRRGSILLAEGKIAAFDPMPQEIPVQCDRIDAEGALLTPGLVDIHTHGIKQFLFERDPQDLIEGAAVLASYGTTCVLPTLYTVLDRLSLAKLERLADALALVAGPEVPGFHLEGPFLALPGAGAITVSGDLILLDELVSAAKGRICAMSVSPDCRNIIPVIERLRDLDIAVFITHTRASLAQTQAAVDAGARHATHFYNVFPIPAETDPGVRPVGAVEVMLTDRRCTVDFICDGVHVDPLVIRLALLSKGWSGIIAITDSNIGAGLDDGLYSTPWGYQIRISQSNAARIDDVLHPLNGCLAGSSLTMDRAIANLLNWLDIPAHEVWAMGTLNPAKAVGLVDKGVMKTGADADVVLWADNHGTFQAVGTWVRGKCVFECEPSIT